MLIRWFVVLLLALNFSACQTEAHQMTPPRIEKLFEKTKPVCFGRFVVDVPVTSQVLLGSQAFGPNIESIQGGGELKNLYTTKIAQLQRVKHNRRPGTLLRDVLDGPTPSGKTLLFFETPSATNVTEVWGYLNVPPHAFIYKGSDAADDATIETETARLNYVASHLRARDPAEVPTEPGVCLDVGFIADDGGQFQEIFGVGFRFPELPDASFSISSNKNAQQGDSFEVRLAEAAGSAKDEPEMAAALAKIKTLRQGKHKVQQGEGSEALFKRPVSEGDGHWHEFQFEYPGKRFDHHNPPWDATLFTGVVRSDAGAARSSLSDEEAIALWDRLMSSVRLRVQTK